MSIILKSGSSGNLANVDSNGSLQVHAQDGTMSVQALSAGGLTVNLTGNPTVNISQPLTILASSSGGLTISDGGGSITVDTTSGPLTILASSSSGLTVNGAVTANIGTTGGIALDSTLTGGTAKTQIVQGGNTTLVSATGALSVDINAIGTNALGQELMVASIPVVIASNQSAVTVAQATAANLNATVTVSNPIQGVASNLCISTTGATGAAVTATLPAVAANFHYVGLIEIVKYFTVANAASATPLVVTTTNFPGSLAFTFGQPLGAIGVIDRMEHYLDSPLKSSTVNTATTIVCPATTGIIWRVNVYYFAAP